MNASAAPSFTLIDDAGGRFAVDPDFGYVSLKDKRLLERERGAVHIARLAVREASGARYELALRLRIDGPAPQMAGAEENDFLIALANAEEPQTPPAASFAL